MYKRQIHRLALRHQGEDPLLVLRRQAILVPFTHALGGCVHEENAVIGTRLLEHDDAGRDRRPKEQVRRQLDDRVHEVVFGQVFADLPLGAAAVQDARELDDRGRPVLGQPVQHVHGEGQVLSLIHI